MATLTATVFTFAGRPAARLYMLILCMCVCVCEGGGGGGGGGGEYLALSSNFHVSVMFSQF